MTDKLDLDAIEARCNAATEGPWKVGSWLDNVFSVVADVWLPICRVKRNDEEATDRNQDVVDAAFIAHARQDIPALTTALREAWAENERLRTQCGELTRKWIKQNEPQDEQVQP